MGDISFEANVNGAWVRYEDVSTLRNETLEEAAKAFDDDSDELDIEGYPELYDCLGEVKRVIRSLKRPHEDSTQRRKV